MSKPLWQPDSRKLQNTNLTRFREECSRRTGRRFANYAELHRFSVEQVEAFWEIAWDVFGVKGERGAKPFLADPDRMPGARFFPKARLNFAENLLAGDGEEDALVFCGEDVAKRRMRWRELRQRVAQLQTWLRDAGVKPGDRVAAIMPNMPESIIGVLAAASIGAVWASCSPDFGVQGVLDRFGQVEPKALIACDGYFYGGKKIEMADKLREVVRRLPTVERVIVVPYLGVAPDVVQSLNVGLTPQGRRAESWLDAVESAEARPLTFEPVAFAHPLYILFSSGTTGVPKCIVHSVGGTLLKHLCEHRLHTNVSQGDRLFYFTTLGWMMWNWLVSGLASGATLLLYDGSPFHPSANVLWDYAQAEKCTHFGTSAKYIDALKKSGARPRETHDLTNLQMIMSTGSPLAPESFDFVYDGIKSDVQLASISGGTDIVGCFVTGIPTEPVWRGEIQGPGLGMAIDVFGEDGEAISHGKGELVCKRPFPSMPVGFLNDPDGKRYRAAYFERFPGVWHQGDFAEWTEHHGIVIHGRSDATLNPGGVRIGTAEIYRQVEQLEAVQESIVIGQDWDNDVRLVLFVVLKPGQPLSEELKDRIKKQVRTGASPRHVPAKIVAVTDIPRTKSGKITELAVRDVVHGRPVKNKEALANPEALDLFRALPELQT